MRFALIGDTHADEHSRLAEHDRIMAWIGEDAAARGVELYLHSGDVWERRSTSQERIAVANYVRTWAEHAPVVVVGGNHDDPLDIEWLGRLRTAHPALALTRPKVVDVAGYAIACLPWPCKAHLLATLGDVSREQGDQVAVEALKNILRGLGQELDAHDGPRLFLGHVQMRGSRVSISQPPLTGCDFELGIDDLALCRASFYALGHIHLGAGNEWDVAGAPAAYPGSPRRCNFGETEPKGYIIVEFDGPHLVGWERIETPCVPMVHLQAVWEGPEKAFCRNLPTHAFESGAEIRLRYETANDQREAARAAASEVRDELLRRGAISVKVEEVVTTETRARAPEINTATTLEEKLSQLWQLQSFDPKERRENLLGKVRQLEEDHAA